MIELTSFTDVQLIAELERRKSATRSSGNGGMMVGSNLSVLAYANNFTLWHYTMAGNNIEQPGYFNAGRDMLRTNDLIIANVNTAREPWTKFYIVTGNAAGVVTIAAYG